jgi:type II secretory pathway pseudopilin PulG
MENPRLLNSRRKRRAAILVCVLVVLLIVGSLCAQTIQTLLMVRQADRQRGALQQARELIELGRMAIAQQRVEGDGTIELTVDGSPALIQIVQLETTEQPAAEATQETNTATPERYRIIATYSLGSAKEVTATWESPK